MSTSGRLPTALFAGLVTLAMSASTGCSALLDLDVQYVDGGAQTLDAGVDAGETSEAGGSDATTDGALGAGEPDGQDVADGPSAVDAPTMGDEPRPEASASLPDATSDSPPSGGIRFVQVNAQETPNFSYTQTVPLPGVQSHDAIVVAIEYSTMAPVQVTDSLGNTYQLATQLPVDAFGIESEIYYALDVAGGDDGITAYIQDTNQVNTFEVFVQEYSGIGAFDVATGQNSGNLPAADMQSGFVTTSAANELIFGFGIGGTVTQGTGFTPRSTFAADLTEDRILTSPDMVQATAENAGASAWSMMVATFAPR